MFFDSGVEAAIFFTDVSTFTSRTGEFVHYRALVYLAGVLSLFGRNELLLVVFQLMMKLQHSTQSFR